MSAATTDAAARLLERLLADPALRARFRRDPAGCCRAAGLPELAEEMRAAGGRALDTLDRRESRSSLAGVLMAAAIEGVALHGLLSAADDLAPAVSAVLSRVDLRAATASAAPADLGRDDPPAVAPAAADLGPPPVKAAAPADPGRARPVVPPRATEPDGSAAFAAVRSPEGDAGTAGLLALAGERRTGSAREAPEPARVASAPVEPAAPVRPEQLGAEGTGGSLTPEARALLAGDRVVFDDVGVADLKAGRIDPRIVAVLTKLSEEHRITVSCMCSDHAKLTSGGSISNHWFGRGLDIAAIDGVPVNPANFDAREIAHELQELDPRIRPDEIGTPWAIGGPGYFTDAAHQDHLHVGFKQEIDPGWRPPAQLRAGGGGEHPAAAPVARAAAAGPAGPAAAAAARAPGTMRLDAARAGAAGAGRGGTARVLAVPRAAPPEPAEGQAPAAAAEAAPAERAAPARAGPKALAALAEVRRHLGTPYVWGGAAPGGFDCSGLVQYAYAQAGVRIPRVTDQQIAAPGGRAVDRDELRPGDLVFFRDASGYVFHVGMSLGGDAFIHAPRTGDVVKQASLSEPYFAGQFAGGRRFDAAPAAPGADRPAAPDPAAVRSAVAAAGRDAEQVGTAGSMLAVALAVQEDRGRHASVRFLPAAEPAPRGADPAPPAAPEPRAERSAAAAVEVAGRAGDYPGDDASKGELAAWMGAHARRRGLPAELPVMAALVESGLENLGHGHADSVGFFQMRVGIWNRGPYAGYPDRPALQLDWFLDQAEQVKRTRVAQGRPVDDPAALGEWVADVERPAEQFRGRYAERLAEAQRLLRSAHR